MANRLEIDKAISYTEEKYKVVLVTGVCWSLIEIIKHKISITSEQHKKADKKRWFKKIMYSAMNDLYIKEDDEVKTYMTVAGKYFGEHGGRPEYLVAKEISEMLKEDEMKKKKNTDRLQTVFSL